MRGGETGRVCQHQVNGLFSAVDCLVLYLRSNEVFMKSDKQIEVNMNFPFLLSLHNSVFELCGRSSIPSCLRV